AAGRPWHQECSPPRTRARSGPGSASPGWPRRPLRAAVVPRQDGIWYLPVRTGLRVYAPVGTIRLRWSLPGLKVHRVSLGGVSARIPAGAGACLLGAAAATGGSLLAVSLLGRGIIAPAASRQLTVAAVNRALASGAAEAAPPSPAATPPAAPSPT